MKSIAMIIAIILIALIMIIPQAKNELSFSYTIIGCAETETGMTTRSLKEDINASIIITNNTIEYYRGLNHQCCKKAEISYTITDQIINIYETWSGNGCRCMCYSKLKASIKGLKGEYTIKIYENLSNTLLLTESVSIKNPA
ncbi:MAG TPA: hypothetical protein VI790_01730 [Candidatus Nanoarchaeia archaeon]|nr:hypothetical protein [Candidatus Nanoarchaeia archaeon]